MLLPYDRIRWLAPVFVSESFFLLLSPHEGPALLAHGGLGVGTSPEQGGGMRYVDALLFFLLVPGDKEASLSIVGWKASERLLEDQGERGATPQFRETLNNAGRWDRSVFRGPAEHVRFCWEERLRARGTSPDRMAPQQPSEQHRHTHSCFVVDCFPTIVAENNGAPKTTANTRS